MKINISIDGVLRNTIQKINYHYIDYYINSDEDEKTVPIDVDELEKGEDSTEIVKIDFDYKIEEDVHNDKLTNYFKFQSENEYNNFMFIEFPVEIFGHAGVSYPNVFSELHELIYNHKKDKFKIVAVDNLAKAKPSTLFFLSRNGFLGNKIEFIFSENIKKEWKKRDVWITDNEEIIKSCPKGKIAIKFNTDYNKHFTHEYEINKLSEIEELWEKILK